MPLTLTHSCLSFSFSSSWFFPRLLKRLGQYTAAGKDADRPPEQEREAMPEERMHEYFEEPPIGHDYERTQKETFSNKPIHPKWF